MTWLLILNHMRDAKSEMRQPVCRAATRAELEALIERETVEPYQTQDGGRRWQKCFRQGGPLEWFNPPDGAAFTELDVEERVASYRANLEASISRIPHIGMVVHGEEVGPTALGSAP